MDGRTTLSMRLTLPIAIITIILYEMVLITVSSRRAMALIQARNASRQGDWIETIHAPLWWWTLVVLPPVLLIGYWAYRRAR